MKKLFLLAIAGIVLAACDKEQNPEQKGVPFVAGQKVTLSADVLESSSKVTSKSDGDGIKFEWQTGDKIKITVSGESAEFTLSSGAGTSSAQFTGEMPASGSTFDVQYPVTAPESITTQTYSATEPFEHDKMLFTATGCTLDESGENNFELKAQNSVLKLKLYGKNVTLNKIELVTDATYTLNIETPIKLGDTKETANSFHIIVPEGTFSSFQVKTYVTYDESKVKTYLSNGKGIPVIHNLFTTKNSNTFTAGEVLSMPEKEITTVIWAPVNLGYHATNFKFGKQYQWGRTYGGGYNDNATYTEETKPTITEASWNNAGKYTVLADGTFYKTTNGINPGELADWYTNTQSLQLKKWPMTSSDEGYEAGKIANPCPENWRVPTKEECQALHGGKEDPTLSSGIHGTTSDLYGINFDGTPDYSLPEGNKVFLPATGYTTWRHGTSQYRSENLDYWSQSVSDFKAWGIVTLDNHTAVKVLATERAYGFGVRCVQAEQ